MYKSKSYWKFFTQEIKKKIHIDADYFIKAGISSNIRTFLDAILGFLLIFFLTNNFNQNKIGKYFLSLSLLGLASILTVEGLNISATNSFLKEKYSSYKRNLKYRSIGISIAVLVMLASTIFVYFRYPSFWQFMLVISFLVPYNIPKLHGIYLYTKDKFKKLTIIEVIEKVLYYGTTMVLILLGFDLLLILAVFLGLQLVYNWSFTIFYLFKVEKEEDTESIDESLVPDGLKFSGVMLFDKMAVHLDKIVISYLLGLEALAIYGIALLIPKNLFQVIKKFANTLFYKKSKNMDKRSVIKIFKKISVYIFLLALLLGTGLWIIMPIVFKLLFPNYMDAILYAQVFSLLFMFIILIEFGRLYLKSNERPDDLLKLHFLGSGMQVVSYFLFIPMWGLWGGIISIAIGFIAETIFVVRKVFY